MKSSPKRIPAHTGLSQELEDLAISDNHVLQTCSTGKPENVDSTTIDKLVTEDQFIESPKSDQHSKMPRSDDSLLKQEEGHAICAKEKPLPKPLKPPEKTSNECGLSSETPKSFNKPTAFQEDFVETLLNNEWVKVEIVERNVRAGGGCLVQRLDGRGHRFMVNTEDVAPLGSNDPESE